jgi:hypothetical protein
MHNGNTLRIMMTGAIAALAVAVPVAEAKQPASSGVAVCNQATHTSQGGNLDSTSFGDTGSAVKYQTGLKAKPGNGAGLARAAENSPALSLCVAPSTPPVVVDDPFEFAS